MYGPTKRAVLSSRVVTTTGLRLVSVAGRKGSHPLGFWYERDGKYYADLKSGEQWYQLVNNHTIANKGLGGTATKQELRDFVLAYWAKEEAA